MWTTLVVSFAEGFGIKRLYDEITDPKMGQEFDLAGIKILTNNKWTEWSPKCLPHTLIVCIDLRDRVPLINHRDTLPITRWFFSPLSPASIWGSLKALDFIKQQGNQVVFNGSEEYALNLLEQDARLTKESIIAEE